MNTVSYSHTRQNLKTIFDKACNDIEPIFVKRQKGKNVVILSEEEYQSLNETAYLFSNSANKKHIQESLKEIQNNETIEITIDEL